MQNIIPENVSIWYENNKPYLDYTGTTITNKGKIRLHFPKLGLSFDKIVVEKSEHYFHAGDNRDLVFNHGIAEQNVYMSKVS